MYNRVAFNEQVVSAVKDGNFSKIAESISPYIRERIYEMSFIEQVLKVRNIETTDLIPEEKNDTNFVYGQLEQPTDLAITMNFRGKPFTKTHNGRRYKIPLGYNSTDITSKSEQEMMAFSYDLFADLEQKEIFELHYMRDSKLIAMLNACVALSSKTKDFDTASGTVVIHPEKAHFVTAANILETGDRQSMPDRKTLKCTKYLCSSTILNDLALWDSVDVDTMAAELATNGWTSTRLLNKELIVSNKNALFVEKDGNHLYDVVYALPDGDFLGEVIHVNGMEIKPEVWRENGEHKISRRSSEYFAAGIGNYNGVSKIRLMRKYGG